MKTKLLILAILIFTSFSSFAIHIYSITSTINMGGGCIIFQTTFWDDMGTSTNTADDRYMGLDNIVECGHNPMIPEDLDDIKFDEDGSYIVPAGVKMIPYYEYQERRKLKDAIRNEYIYKQGTIELSNSPEIKQIDVEENGGK